MGLTLVFLGRFCREAMARFKKVLKAKPRHVDALFGTAQIAALEGRFEEAERLCKRVLEIQPEKAAPWTALANLRRMTASDAAWIERASTIAAGGLVPLEEAGLRFAIGKYWDDIGDFERAFRSYERANQLLKPIAEPYSRDARAQFVDTLIKVYSREAISRVGGGRFSLEDAGIRSRYDAFRYITCGPNHLLAPRPRVARESWLFGATSRANTTVLYVKGCSVNRCGRVWRKHIWVC